mmetsp:Transcript_12505/g.20802  ORF Transcript_12505/g.20802 Transcript_12505/m.20802 type:complete len:157 (-) Transcript_12505:696-1166(-)
MISICLLVLFYVCACTDAYNPFPRPTQLSLMKKLRPIATGIVAGTLSVAVVNEGAFLSSPPVVNAAQDISVFVGKYSDPFHPGCPRSVEIVDGQVVVKGSDNTDGSKPWTLVAETKADGSLLIDFSPKGGPKDLKAEFISADNGIKFPDGNLWSKK